MDVGIWSPITDPTSRTDLPLPEVLRVLSFGRIVWMLEKAGITHTTVRERRSAVLCCADNIARWWMVEHKEFRRRKGKGGFIGDKVMHRDLMPNALWLGMREFGGIWGPGVTENLYNPNERYHFLRKYKNEALLDVLTIRGTATTTGPEWKPIWYRDEFVDWAQEIARMSTLPNVSLHSAKRRENWCGLEKCPYPYVMEYFPPSPGRLTLPKGSLVGRKEEPTPIAIRTPMRYVVSDSNWVDA